MLKSGGTATITEADGTVSRKNDTFSCGHCNQIVLVPPGTVSLTVGGTCRACMHHICDGCIEEMERTLRCVPLEERLRQMEMSGSRNRRGGRRG